VVTGIPEGFLTPEEAQPVSTAATAADANTKAHFFIFINFISVYFVLLKILGGAVFSRREGRVIHP
jgi:hypothetical protein